MNTAFESFLASLEFGPVQQYRSITLFPLLCSGAAPRLEYLTLSEALKNKLLSVKELSEGGSVPELCVINRAQVPVLLLDGEELAGAKQNRILNTTVLVQKDSETVIPVSCTEQGRWSYDTREFFDSDLVAPAFLRQNKSASVSRNLDTSQRFTSNQSEVWDNVACFSISAKVNSPTHAYKDIHNSRKEDLETCLRSFPCLPGQAGILVFINGKPAGFDAVPDARKFVLLHAKLVKSYAIDALVNEKESQSTPSVESALDFIRQAGNCEEKKYKSPGHGWDYRYTGPSIIGTALIFQDQVVHSAFFHRESGADNEQSEMSGFRRRRDYRY